MNRRKALSLALILVMLCALLSGCIYVDSETSIRDNGAGTVSFASGVLAEEGEEPEEGQEVFEANGKKYYGTRTSYEFATPQEFNTLFTPEGEGAIEGNANAACTLRKNSDGSLTLVVRAINSEDAESDVPADASIGSQDGYEDAFVRYTFNFDQPLRQLSGPATAVSVDGGRLTLDLLKQTIGEANSVYVFVTDVAAAVVPTQQALKVDGTARETEIYNINGSNYFKLRDMAALLTGTGAQFSVEYDGASSTIRIKTGEAYAPAAGDLSMPSAEQAAEKAAGAVKSAQNLTINGEPAYLAPYNIGGNNYFALRDLGGALGFGVDYDAATGTMLVSTKS